MPRLNQGEDVRPVDMEIGGHDDTPGISQELTTDDVDDVAFDAHLSVGKRQRQLMGLLEEMRTRRSGDYMGDMEEIASHIRDRLASLGSPQESQSVLESTGMYPDDRSDDDDRAYNIAYEEPEEDSGP